MSEKKGAYSTTAADTSFRRKWDKDEYAEKARQKDADEKERMQENEQRMKQGGYASSLSTHLYTHYGRMFCIQVRSQEREENWMHPSQLSS